MALLSKIYVFLQIQSHNPMTLMGLVTAYMSLVADNP
jgi:hypothetical protein